MRKKVLMLFTALMMILALFAPAVSAADYPQNGQFIAYYDEDKLVKDISSKDGGTTYYNGAAEAASSLIRTTTRSTPDPEDWPLLMYNELNVGLSPCDGLPADYLNNGTLNMANSAIGAVNPVIANGHIFIMSGYNGFDEPQDLEFINLTCVNENTLQTEWIFNMSRLIHYGSWSSPAYDYENDYVYAASDNKLYCINVSIGEEVWNFTTFGSTSCNGGPTVGGNWVFFSDWQGSGDGPNYYCLDKTTKEVKWIFNSTKVTGGLNYMEYAQATPAYESLGSNEYIYVAGWGYDDVWHQAGYIFKIKVSDGTMVWGDEVSDLGGFCGSPSIGGGYVYITSYHFSDEGALFKYSKRGTGDISYVDYVRTNRTDATPSIDLASDRIYVSGGCGIYAPSGVTCYNTSLSMLWCRSNEDMGGWTCSVAAGNDTDGHEVVFVGSEEPNPPYCYHTLNALYAINGTTKWSHEGGGATVAIAHDKIYTVDNMGDVWVFR